MSRYRRLRGMVIHALPRLRNLGIPEGRQLIRLDMLPPRKSTGRCHWCRLPIEDKGKRFWDIDCRKQVDAALGYRVFPSPSYWATCAECGLPKERHSRFSYEVDHRIPIHQARDRGPKAFVNAFMLENLQWLCPSCHKAKTSRDARVTSERRVKAKEIKEKVFRGLVNVGGVRCPECRETNMRFGVPDKRKDEPKPCLICDQCGHKMPVPAEVEAMAKITLGCRGYRRSDAGLRRLLCRYI